MKVAIICENYSKSDQTESPLLEGLGWHLLDMVPEWTTTVSVIGRIKTITLRLLTKYIRPKKEREKLTKIENYVFCKTF